MASPIINSHFRDPANRGHLDGADATGQAGASSCGAEIVIYLRFDGACIGEARFEASGSSAIIAAGSATTTRLRGMAWQKAAAISPDAVIEMLTDDSGDCPPALVQAADFTIEALHAAFENAVSRGTFPRDGATDSNVVLVAMSGGVDSSTACLLLKNAGRDVIGMTMRLWRNAATGDEDGISCCSPQAIRDARAVCHRLGLPHLTVDYREAFEREVVDYFVREYLRGRTPNPCAHCNGSFRFPALVELGDRMGAANIATGHYARVVERGGRLLIGRGNDREKDQSYMLWGISQTLLERVRFPLGEVQKAETRELAREGGLPVHDRKESQDVCFIPDDDYRRFLVSRLGDGSDALPGAGDIIDNDGNRLGSHGGFMNYTIGQRRGLGVSAPEPLFVLSIDAGSNVVVVGARDELAVVSLQITGINCFLLPEEISAVDVQVRYNSPALTGAVISKESSMAEEPRHEVGQRWEIGLDEPAYGVAPGQSAVLYHDDVVVAGGVITSTG